MVMILSLGSINAQDYLLPPRPSKLTSLAPFYHGVASGDPLSDRVIIWTRVTIPFLDKIATVNIDSPSAVYTSTIFDTTIFVSWQMALDTTFSSIIDSGTVTTDSSIDYTIKVDVTGLQPNTWYYYRFNSGTNYSIIGRTRTLPVGNVDSIRFAVYSCSDFQSGYFNVYHDIAHRNDLDAVIHLGDFYYEYQAGGSDYQGDATRLHPLGHDAVSVADYRLWHSQYKLDPDQRDIFQQYPWIQIWDDHDVANNGWNSGAQNHNPQTQGDWYVRKYSAFKAYFEWMPIRQTAPGNDSIIHRNFKWGNLANLIMLDTRFEGRDSSLGAGIPTNNAYLADTNRNMIGPNQLAWVKNQLSDTTVQWRLLGNQVMMAPLATLGLILNGDQWDGYPAERKRLFDYIMQQNIKDVVVLSGDIHSSWASDLPHPDSTYNSSTGHGSVATEFIGSSVTSSATGINIPQALIQLSDPYFKYIEFTKRGYLLFDVNKQRAQGDFIHTSTRTSRVYTTSNDAQWVNLDGNRFLGQAAGPIPSRNTNPPFAPFIPDPAIGVGVNNISADKTVLINCYPNPSFDEVAIQMYLNEATKITVNLYDINGNLVTSQYTNPSVGVFTTKLSLSGIGTGTYMLSINDGTNVYVKKIVKN